MSDYLLDSHLNVAFYAMGKIPKAPHKRIITLKMGGQAEVIKSVKAFTKDGGHTTNTRVRLMTIMMDKSCRAIMLKAG